MDVTVDGSGNIYIADEFNNRIRLVSAQGTISTVAGTNNYLFTGDNGDARSAFLSYPQGLATDTAGNLYVADFDHFRVRMISPANIITTVAGNGTYGDAGDGGAPASASFRFLGGLAVDGQGNLFVADSGSQRVRKIAAQRDHHHIRRNGQRRQ